MATGQAAKSTRTVVIAGVPDGLLQDDVMADILTIHFQMSRNNGGDVEEVRYPTRNEGVAYVTFENQEVVESVLKKDKHLLQDKRLPRHYPLTVTRYYDNAFSSVTSVLNMAVFKDHFVLEELVEEMKKQSTALSFGPLQPNGHLAVQGSFPALQVLRDLLLLKAKSLSEKGRREESKSHLRPRRRPQEHGGVAERRNSVREARGEKQEVVLDTDIYRYMRCFYPRKFQGNGVVVSDVSDGEITTVCFENAGRRADAQHVVRVKEMIEDLSIKLQSILCKERIYFKERTRGEKQRYKMVCERLKRRFPKVLITVCDTHIDLIGTFSEIFEFAKEAKSQCG